MKGKAGEEWLHVVERGGWRMRRQVSPGAFIRLLHLCYSLTHTQMSQCTQMIDPRVRDSSGKWNMQASSGLCFGFIDYGNLNKFVWGDPRDPRWEMCHKIQENSHREWAWTYTRVLSWEIQRAFSEKRCVPILTPRHLTCCYVCSTSRWSLDRQRAKKVQLLWNNS